ncbi:hypothetical protein MtrunA17_Chr8g0388821 [Medicago truncatula]|uniref:Uncharacterized protein n=1 Tax=Medicago truncatula TaxID=3880 RepID=A0A396GTL7_MEDTR|nr:hypothetical protein MtrunA17_Chr8g0388821 [Medicago truncatula]
MVVRMSLDLTGYFPTQIFPKRMNLNCPCSDLRVFHFRQKTIRLRDKILWIRVHEIMTCSMKVSFYKTIQIMNGH